MPSDDALVLLHLLSLNETAREQGRPMVTVRDVSAWDELSHLGAIDQWGEITAVGREILGEVQPEDAS